MVVDRSLYVDPKYCHSDLGYLVNNEYVISLDKENDLEEICVLGKKSYATDKYIKCKGVGKHSLTLADYRGILMTPKYVKQKVINTTFMTENMKIVRCTKPYNISINNGYCVCRSINTE